MEGDRLCLRNTKLANSPGHPQRRSFLKASSAITAMVLVGTGTLSSIAHADALTKAQRERLTPDDILAVVKKGNKRFYTGEREDQNLLAQQRANAKGQYPAETIMDLRIDDIFNSRVAGNVENSDILGNMEFACKTGRRQGGSGHGPYGVRCY